MKWIRNIFWIVSICFFSSISPAQAIQRGEDTVSVYGGLGTALQKSGLEIDGKRLSWGNIGTELGFSYFYFPSEYMGIGVDVHYAGFQGSKRSDEVPGRRHWHCFSSDFDMHTFHIMGAERINLNPQARIRFYIPLGAEIAFAKGKMQYMWDDHVIDTQTSLDRSFSWYAGLGFEFDQNSHWAWGIEARYNSFHYDYSGLAGRVEGKTARNNNEHSYISLVIKFQFK